MINKGKTELRFWVDADNNEVDPSTPNAREVIVGPGQPIPVHISEEKRQFLEKSGHLARQTGETDRDQKAS